MKKNLNTSYELKNFLSSVVDVSRLFLSPYHLGRWLKTDICFFLSLPVCLSICPSVCLSVRRWRIKRALYDNVRITDDRFSFFSPVAEGEARKRNIFCVPKKKKKKQCEQSFVVLYVVVGWDGMDGMDGWLLVTTNSTSVHSHYADWLMMASFWVWAGGFFGRRQYRTNEIPRWRHEVGWESGRCSFLSFLTSLTHSLSIFGQGDQEPAEQEMSTCRWTKPSEGPVAISQTLYRRTEWNGMDGRRDRLPVHPMRRMRKDNLGALFVEMCYVHRNTDTHTDTHTLIPVRILLVSQLSLSW